MPLLGVNIDHVATLRQARREFEPDPIEAATICERAGADSIVCHLREDRRHISEFDVRRLRKVVKTRLNLEMSLNAEIIELTASLNPDVATLVPEKRQEITTEGGLNVEKYFHRIKRAVKFLKKYGIEVSLFIDPVKKQILKARDTGATMIELHTGQYAQTKNLTRKSQHLKKIREMTRFGQERGFIVNAGHGLKYHDTRPIARIKGMAELNIGHSIISRAVFVGLLKAVKDMKRLVR